MRGESGVAEATPFDEPRSAHSGTTPSASCVRRRQSRRRTSAAKKGCEYQALGRTTHSGGDSSSSCGEILTSERE